MDDTFTSVVYATPERRRGDLTLDDVYSPTNDDLVVRSTIFPGFHDHKLFFNPYFYSPALPVGISVVATLYALVVNMNRATRAPVRQRDFDHLLRVSCCFDS